jgi:hypothetical protein
MYQEFEWRVSFAQKHAKAAGTANVLARVVDMIQRWQQKAKRIEIELHIKRELEKNVSKVVGSSACFGSCNGIGDS